MLSFNCSRKKENSIWIQKGGTGAERRTIGGPHPEAPEYKNSGYRVRFAVEGQDHGLNIRAVIEPSGQGFVSGYTISHAPGEKKKK